MGEALAPLIAIAMVATTIVMILRGPLGRALARRIEGSAGLDHDLVQRVEELETRLLAVEQVEARLAETEERLDFTERMLAKERKSLLPDRND